MARSPQGRIPGTDGSPVPDHIAEKIVELKKRQDSRKRAQGAERKAQAAANQACLDAGYPAGERLHLPDESPPLWFEVKAADPKVVVKVEGREKRDDIDASGDADGEDAAPAPRKAGKKKPPAASVE